MGADVCVDTDDTIIASGYRWSPSFPLQNELYGTASGGDGLIIRPFNFVLPNSKLVINSTSALGLDSTGHVNEEVRTQPDVFYESAFGNWTELIDFTISDLSES